MATLVLKLTDAGLAAVQAASGSDPTVIESLGLTATPFDYAPTLTGLPGEFKRVEVSSGVASAANVTHLTAYDTSADVWTATGFGLFLDDGTLFAVHSGTEPVMSKVGLAFALLAFDIAFEADFAANIAYGNAVFAYPTATQDMPGIAEIATPEEVEAGSDHRRFVTPLTLWQRLKTVFQSIVEEGAARAAGDDVLNTAITHEATARAGADDALSTALINESAARAAGDAGLNTAIDSEASARSSADAALQSKINVVAAYEHVTSKRLTENGGYLVYSSGRKETWGVINVPANSSVNYNLPVDHNDWVNPSFAVSSVRDNVNIQENTGISAIIGNPPTAIQIWNADDRNVTVWMRTVGV